MTPTEPSQRVRSPQEYARLAAITVLLSVAFVYVCDAVLIRYKMAYRGSDAALGTVQFVMAAELKNGKLDYYDVPQTMTCAHSLFPQLGYTPCWYASRSGVQIVGPEPQPLFLPDMRKKY